MKKHKKAFLVLLLLLSTNLMHLITIAANNQKIVKFTYVEFDSDFIVPVTLDNIHRKNDCIKEVNLDNRYLKSIKTILEKKYEWSTFNYYEVRVKIENLFDGDIFIDRSGGVLFIKNYKAVQVEGKELADLRTTVKKIAECDIGVPNI